LRQGTVVRETGQKAISAEKPFVIKNRHRKTSPKIKMAYTRFVSEVFAQFLRVETWFPKSGGFSAESNVET